MPTLMKMTHVSLLTCKIVVMITSILELVHDSLVTISIKETVLQKQILSRSLNEYVSIYYIQCGVCNMYTITLLM